MKLKIKAAVLHVNTSGADSRSPTMRIARYTADTLGIPLIHNLETAKKHRNTRFDVLFMKHGILKFSQHREEALHIHGNAKHTINLENDHTFQPDKRFGTDGATWSTVDSKSKYVNWNVLTWEQPNQWARPLAFFPVVNRLLYYGAYKEIREADLRKYLESPAFPLTVSSFRGGKRFEAMITKEFTVAPKDYEVIGAFRKPDAVRSYAAALYVEDEYSHQLYCSPANRFYECLQYGVAQAFDENVVGTFEKAGIDISKYVVTGRRDIKPFLANFDKIRRAQRKAWHDRYDLQLESQLVSACKSTFGRDCLIK